METKDFFLLLSICFSIISLVIGIYTILKGQYKPQRITRLVLLINTSLFFPTLYAQGDRIAIYLAVVQFISSVIIFLFSFKYGIGGKSKTDFLVFFLACIAIMIWQVTNNPTLGLYMSIVGDFIALVPTIIKSYKMPQTESWKFYASDVLASFFSILSFHVYLFKNVVFSGYILFINLVIMRIIILRKNKKYENIL